MLKNSSKSSYLQIRGDDGHEWTRHGEFSLLNAGKPPNKQAAANLSIASKNPLQ
jgi:flagellar basal body rod protein FlgG